jgi:ferredoxin-NADP reductase
MAVPKIARVIGGRMIGPDTKIIELALADGSPFGFRGGQYAIVNTGVVLPGDKLAKRAYSFFSDDRDQDRVTLAVKRLGAGPGSNAMHDAPVGTEMPFSGPWGKSYPDAATEGASLILATDTGITAAMGIARSKDFARLAANADLVWYVAPGESFLPESFVRDFLATSGVRVHVERALPIGHPERLAHMRGIIERHAAERGVPANGYLSGDGILVYGVREQLVAMGAREENVKLEAFFNNPARKAP